MKRVEKTNIVMICPNQRARFSQYSPYAMNVNRKRNCYSCREFGHLTQNCRRQVMGQGKRMEYKDNRNNKNNLNGEEDLIVLD